MIIKYQVNWWLGAAFILMTGAGESLAAEYYIDSGTVQYHVRAKTLGFIVKDITGVNTAVKGDLHFTDSTISGTLLVPVTEFKSGIDKRDRDVADILKHEEFPFITLDVPVNNDGSIKKIFEADSGSVIIPGRLTVAGNSRIYELKIDFKWINKIAMQLRTTIEAYFSDFKIERPTFGGILARAPEDLKLSGDILFTEGENAGNSLQSSPGSGH